MSKYNIAEAGIVGCFATLFALVITGFASVIGFVNLAFQGFVLSRLWEWFIHEPFKVQNITVWHGFGLVLIASVLSRRNNKLAFDGIKKETEPLEWWKHLVNLINPSLALLFTWGIGYLVHTHLM